MSLLLYVVQYSDHTRSHAFCPPEFTIFGPISYNVLRMEEVGGTSEGRRRRLEGRRRRSEGHWMRMEGGWRDKKKTRTHPSLNLARYGADKGRIKTCLFISAKRSNF